MSARTGTLLAIVAFIALALATTGVPRIELPERAAQRQKLELAPERVDASDSEAGQWKPDDFPLRMPIPEGWTAVRRNGRPYLMRDPDDAKAGNFNLLRLPNLFGRSLDGLLEENRKELSENPQFELISSGIVVVDGAKAVRVEYIGKPRGDEESLTCLTHVFLSGTQQIVLTLTVRSPQAAEVMPSAKSSLEHLVVKKSEPKPAQ
jgi:hypothetical protein